MSNTFAIRLIIAGILLVCGLLIFARMVATPAGPVVPESQPAETELGKRVLASFSVNPPRAESVGEAMWLAGVFYKSAECLEYECSSPDAWLKTGRDWDQYRISLIRSVTKGKRYGDMYPDLPAVVGKYLDEKSGKSGGPMTPEIVAARVSAVRELGNACEYAAYKLSKQSK
jgi:hypothetical protein